jgi:hypothetical protein
MALRWGARTGAVPERAVLAAIDLVLALRDRDDGVALDSVERLECEAKGYSEPTFRDLLVSAEQLATPVMAARIAALRS